MSSLRSFLLGLVFASCATVPLVAQFPMPLGRTPDESAKPAEIREIVSKFCRLDYDGARLDSRGWPSVQPVVWWKTNPDYTQINVISRYTVDTAPVMKHGKYTVSVHYRLLGSYDLVTGYVPEPANTVQDVDYTVTAVNDEWRISDADNPYPHPSRAAMLKWLNDKIASTQDANAKTLYQEALRQLRAQSGSPFAQ